MKSPRQLHNIEYICFCMGAVTFCLAHLIPGIGILSILGWIATGGVGFLLTLFLVEVYLSWSLKNDD